MKKKLRVLLKKAHKEFGEVIEVEDTLKNWQDLVGGYIETYPLTDDIIIILNEEGKLKELPTNIGIPYENGSMEVLVGDIVFVSVKGDCGEDFASLTDEQIEFLRNIGMLA